MMLQDYSSGSEHSPAAMHAGTTNSVTCTVKPAEGNKLACHTKRKLMEKTDFPRFGEGRFGIPSYSASKSSAVHLLSIPTSSNDPCRQLEWVGRGYHGTHSERPSRCASRHSSERSRLRIAGAYHVAGNGTAPPANARLVERCR